MSSSGLESSRNSSGSVSSIGSAGVLSPKPEITEKLTVIAGRVFVGGIPPGTSEADLKAFFETTFGSVKEAKIVKTHAGAVTNRGYGFITFEKDEDAQHVLEEIQQNPGKGIEFNSKRLNIGPAIRKQHSFPFTSKPPAPAGGAIVYGSNGIPYLLPTGYGPALNAANTHHHQQQLPQLQHQHQPPQQQQQSQPIYLYVPASAFSSHLAAGSAAATTGAPILTNQHYPGTHGRILHQSHSAINLTSAGSHSAPNYAVLASLGAARPPSASGPIAVGMHPANVAHLPPGFVLDPMGYGQPLLYHHGQDQTQYVAAVPQQTHFAPVDELTEMMPNYLDLQQGYRYHGSFNNSVFAHNSSSQQSPHAHLHRQNSSGSAGSVSPRNVFHRSFSGPVNGSPQANKSWQIATISGPATINLNSPTHPSVIGAPILQSTPMQPHHSQQHRRGSAAQGKYKRGPQNVAENLTAAVANGNTTPVSADANGMSAGAGGCAVEAADESVVSVGKMTAALGDGQQSKAIRRLDYN